MSIDELIESAEKKSRVHEYHADIFENGNPMRDACIKSSQDCKQLAEWFKQLKEYQQLEADGRLIKLPCKIGCTIYNTTWWDDVQEKVVVKGKTYYRTVRKHKITKSTFDYSDIKDFGETVFLTKSEAEAKLKELRGAE